MSATAVTRPNRRDFLQIATGAFAGVGTLAAAWPLVNSLKPASDVLVTLEISLSGLAPGQSRYLKEDGKLFVLRHRSAEEIAVLGNDDRAIAGNPAFVILVPLCTDFPCAHAKCVLIDSPSELLTAVWQCACCGSKFDGVGRPTDGPVQYDLEIPRYEVIDRDTIRIV